MRCLKNRDPQALEWPLVLLLTWGSLLFALLSERWWGWEPCVLCMIQRVSFFLLGAHVLVLWWVARTKTVRCLVWSTLLGVWLLGQSAALYQLSWELTASPERMGGCLPSWDVLWSHYSVRDIVGLVWSAEAPCSERSPVFLGLSLAWWGVLLHAATGCLLCAAAYRNKSGLLCHP